MKKVFGLAVLSLALSTDALAGPDRSGSLRRHTADALNSSYYLHKKYYRPGASVGHVGGEQQSRPRQDEAVTTLSPVIETSASTAWPLSRSPWF